MMVQFDEADKAVMIWESEAADSNMGPDGKKMIDGENSSPEMGGIMLCQC